MRFFCWYRQRQPVTWICFWENWRCVNNICILWNFKLFIFICSAAFFISALVRFAYWKIVFFRAHYRVYIFFNYSTCKGDTHVIALHPQDVLYSSYCFPFQMEKFWNSNLYPKPVCGTLLFIYERCGSRRCKNGFKFNTEIEIYEIYHYHSLHGWKLWIQCIFKIFLHLCCNGSCVVLRDQTIFVWFVLKGWYISNCDVLFSR